jgi:hypothetical protein
MLARSSPMPTRAGYAYEPKLDGFRCLIQRDELDGMVAKPLRSTERRATRRKLGDPFRAPIATSAL